MALNPRDTLRAEYITDFLKGYLNSTEEPWNGFFETLVGEQGTALIREELEDERAWQGRKDDYLTWLTPLIRHLDLALDLAERLNLMFSDEIRNKTLLARRDEAFHAGDEELSEILHGMMQLGYKRLLSKEFVHFRDLLYQMEGIIMLS